MGLLKRFFGGGAGSPSRGSSPQFEESDSTAQQASPDHAPRRELVQVVLRDTMRKHGIPSDWMDCRILSVVTQKQQAGMHVQFIVRQGEDRLLPFVLAFQRTFWQELEKFEARPRDWLFSVAWQFDGPGTGVPEARAVEGWEDDTQPPPPDTQPSPDDTEEQASDLQALYAIRDAALSEPTPLPEQAKPPRS
jgi:hypothetical protein